MEYTKVFEKLLFPFIIWKHNSDTKLFECFYSNGKIPGIIVGTPADIYTKNSLYNKVIETKTLQIIHNETFDIYADYISDNLIYEIHYPVCNNVKILSTISHKIRLPLTSIVGILNILDEFKFSSEQKKYIDIIKKSSSDIVAVANDIIDILNLEQGGITLRNNIVSLQNVIESCKKVITNKNKTKSINIIFKVDTNLPKKINIDTTRLEQIIINLLNNAVYNTDDTGQIIVMVSLYEENDLFDCPFEYQKSSSSSVNILFKIKDTGSGIDSTKKEVIESILDIDNKTVDKKIPYKFNGFGLYISKKICNLMNGHIWFKTERDIGSIFYFNIICEGFYI